MTKATRVYKTNLEAVFNSGLKRNMADFVAALCDFIAYLGYLDQLDCTICGIQRVIDPCASAAVTELA